MSSSISTPDHHEQQQQPPPFMQSPQPRLVQTPKYRYQRRGGPNLKVPSIRRTNPFAWLMAVCCAIFCLIVILGGLAVLIVYLAFKPRSPRFDISSVTLNAAYIDTGSLLNADLTILTNFTNQNKRMSVDFSFMVLQLYYNGTLIATRAIDPFSTTSMESTLQSVEMISSQVALPVSVSEQLRQQMEENGVLFDLKGAFRTRSNFVSVFRYSYWLYSSCRFVTTRPPSGILVAYRCTTKR